MKNRILSSKRGALLGAAVFFIVGIAAIVPFLIQSADTSGQRTKFVDEWNKIRWAVSGVKNKYMEEETNANIYAPYEDSTVATISYSDFHVSAAINERRTMLAKNSCFSVAPTVFRGSLDSYDDGGYDLSDYYVSVVSPGVTAGSNHSFAWKQNGDLYAWGNNNAGQLGLGDEAPRTPQLSPEFVNEGALPALGMIEKGALPALGNIKHFNQGWLVAAGGDISAAVCYSGELYGWGEVNNMSYPDDLNFANVLDVECGDDFVALLADGGDGISLYRRSWDNEVGLTGANFELVSGISDVIGIAGGASHIVAITAGGNLWGLGDNSNYQLGLADTSIGDSPIQISESEVVAINGSFDIQNGGTGKATTFYSPRPFDLTGLTVVTNKEHGQNKNYDYMMFLDCTDDSNDTKIRFGDSDFERIGGQYHWKFEGEMILPPGTYTVRLFEYNDQSGSAENDASAYWVTDSNGKGIFEFYASVSIADFVQVAAGASFSMALGEKDEDRILYCWGANDQGQLGLGHTNTVISMTPIQNFPSDSEKLRFVAAGKNHVLALTEDGKVYAWGDNDSGQLGLGDMVDKNAPVLVSGLSGKKIISIAAGDSHSLAMDSDFNVYAWGDNNFGQLGLGDTADRNVPILVSGFESSYAASED